LSQIPCLLRGVMENRNLTFEVAAMATASEITGAALTPEFVDKIYLQSEMNSKNCLSSRHARSKIFD